MRRRMYLWKIWALGVSLVLLGACQQEPLDGGRGGNALGEGEMALQWIPANMGVMQVGTRAGDAKTNEEQTINNVHVFIFDAYGEYLKPEGADASQFYRFLDGRRNCVLNTDMFGDQEKAQRAVVYALANLPQDTFKDADGDGVPDAIGDMGDLEAFVFTLPQFTVGLPEVGLPMVGKVEGVDLSASATTKIVPIQLESLMARVDLNFTMEPTEECEDGEHPTLTFERVYAGNFPTGGRILPQLEGQEEVTEGIALEEATTNEPGLEIKTDLTGKLIRKGQGASMTFYIFEHGRASKALGDAVITTVDGEEVRPFPDGKYPENITEAEKQRYKNILAHEEAAYIELEGRYENHNAYGYKVVYRLYPGANYTDDFTLRGNCQYKHNITVKGITVNHFGDEALLDTRVTIDKDENKYFIEMLRERKHDSHFNVTPMDIYIAPDYRSRGATVTVSIDDPERHAWIRMEPMKYSPTSPADPLNPETGKQLFATKAGEGQRDYFTIDLLAELDRQQGSRSYTTTERAAEERIYFYIDENTPETGELDADGNVVEREATVRVAFQVPGQAAEEREIVIKQAGMRKVHFNKFAPGGSHSGVNRDAYDFYIEEYEEYLAHYDGKNLYTGTYEGLPWGLSGLETNLDGRDWHTYLDYGWRNTMSIMKQYRDVYLRGEAKKDMTLNDKPSSAAEYCYNKNKRDADGKVREVHWYLPTISELEFALERYYGAFNVFQDKWYWSSNPGCSNGATGEDPDYARATKIKYDPDDPEADGSGWVHVQSDADRPYETGEGGHARRGEIFRIRAAYIHERPYRDAPSLDNSGNVSNY